MDFPGVYISKLIPAQAAYGMKTDVVYFEEDSIEQSTRAVEMLQLEHISVRAKNLGFLKDKRLQHVKGITIQHDVEDITPLYGFTQLTHLALGVKAEIDFGYFPNLIRLNCTFPKKYINLQKCTRLQYTQLFSYRKKDLAEFANCSALENLWIYGTEIESFNGLSGLRHLKVIHLENCRKLHTLAGIDASNTSLESVFLVNAQGLKNADALAALPCLKKMQLFNVLEIDSLAFLESLHAIEIIGIHPDRLGVKNKDYYPLIEALKRTGKLKDLKSWKPLNDYLENKVVIPAGQAPVKSGLALIRESLPIMGWTDKRKSGLTQYTKKNCQKAEAILMELIDQLMVSPLADITVKEALFEKCVTALNTFNDSLGKAFIETGEREELCDLLDTIADAAGISLQNYENGIAANWKNW